MKGDLEKKQKSESQVTVLLGYIILHNNPTVLRNVNTGLVVFFILVFVRILGLIHENLFCIF